MRKYYKIMNEKIQHVLGHETTIRLIELNDIDQMKITFNDNEVVTKKLVVVKFHDLERENTFCAIYKVIIRPETIDIKLFELGIYIETKVLETYNVNYKQTLLSKRIEKDLTEILETYYQIVLNERSVMNE